MAVVKCRDPRTGNTYVYTSECFYDEEQGKYRYKRKCIGKVNPETGETIPTGARGGYRKKRDAAPTPDTGEPRKPGRKPTKESSSEYEKTLAQLENLKGQNLELKQQVLSLEEDKKELQRKLNRVKKQMEQMAAAL